MHLPSIAISLAHSLYSLLSLRALPVPSQSQRSQSTMRLVVQRVSQASVTSTLNSTTTTQQIPSGLLALVGFEQSDTPTEATAAAKQLLKLRLFPSPEESSTRASLTVEQAQQQLLLVSQFTLSATLKSGRASFHRAMAADQAEQLWKLFIEEVANGGVVVKSGVFGSFMQVHSVNDGPFTICLTAREGKCDAW